LLALLVLAATSAKTDTPTFDEYEVKAAYLYHFGQFVTWPGETSPEEDGRFIIGILGVDPFGEKLDTRLKGRSIRDRVVEVQRYKTPKDVGPCHILFIASGDEEPESPVLEQFSRQGVLTVGDAPGFARRGGTIGFYLEADAVRFEINHVRAQSIGLKISSKLLGLARIVEDSESTESDNHTVDVDEKGGL
jgi:hypothetical protein